MLKTCSECGKEFQTRGSAKRCGPPCSAAYAKRYDVERSKNPMRAASRAKRKRERIATDEEYRLSQRAINAKRIKERRATDPELRKRHSKQSEAAMWRRRWNDPAWIAKSEKSEAVRAWHSCPIVQRLKARLAAVRFGNRYNSDEAFRLKNLDYQMKRWHTDPEWRAMRYAAKARRRGDSEDSIEEWLENARAKLADERAAALVAAHTLVATELAGVS